MLTAPSASPRSRIVSTISRAVATGVVAVLRDQEMGGAVDVEIGDGREDEP
jgi:hypothetical protein